MDISKILALILSRLHRPVPLKVLRTKKGYSQRDLALLSGVKERSIKGYEQGTLDIAKAQGNTLHDLAVTLGCTMEDLIR